MPTPQPPVVVVPGITATNLRDEYPVGSEPVWGIFRKSWDRIHLHPDDVRYELREPARVHPDSVFGYPYRDFIEDLRHDLAPSSEEPVPVFPFAYDWRLPLDLVERQLETFVEEVAARTALLRHYHAAGYTAEQGPVDLIGHSMGGLIISGYLQRTEGRRGRKVVTLGTPFKGSFEAALKMITGLGALGDSASREREVARLTPALYHLLPRFQGSVTADPGLGRDLFRANTWQGSVIATIAEQMRTHGLEGEGRRRAELLPEAEALFQELLTQASDHRARIMNMRLGHVGMTRHDWLAVVGVGERTRVHLHIQASEDGTPWFDLRSADRKNGYPEEDRDEHGNLVARTVDTGDGTVPYEAAVPPFLSPEDVVCVTDDDFGYWELRDRVVEGGLGSKSAGLHSLLPAMNVVEKMVVCHLKGEAAQAGPAHGGVWGRRAPDVQEGGWRPPLEGLRERGR